MLSVLIVTHGQQDLVRQCLDSVFRGTRVPSEVVVVDSGSQDGTAKMVAAEFPDAQLIEAGRNVGFASGVNLAARRARGSHLVLVNPDALVHEGALDNLLNFAQAHPHAGIYGGRTLQPDGSLDPRSCWGAMTLWSTLCFALGASTLFAGSRWLDPESLGPWARDTVRSVSVVSGCLMLVSREVWDQLGGFDERFWLYGEDVDLCLRARRVGWRPLVTPAAEITHFLGASSSSRADQIVRIFQAKLTLMMVHWSAPKRYLGRWLLLIGVALRAHLAHERCPHWTAAWRRRAEWLHPYPQRKTG